MNLQPMDGSLARDVAPSSPHDWERVKLARKLANKLQEISYVPMGTADLERRLIPLVDQLFAAIKSEPFSGRVASGIGTQLVELRCANVDGLRPVVNLLGKSLLVQPELRRVDGLASRLVTVISVLTGEFAQATQRFAIAQQERVREALLKALMESQKTAIVSEGRFEIVAANLAIGVGITDLDGRISLANDAMSQILGYSNTELLDRTVFDLLDGPGKAALRETYRRFLDGELDQAQQDQRLVRQDGSQLPVSIALAIRSSGDLPCEVILIMNDDQNSL